MDEVLNEKSAAMEFDVFRQLLTYPFASFSSRYEVSQQTALVDCAISYRQRRKEEYCAKIMRVLTR